MSTRSHFSRDVQRTFIRWLLVFSALLMVATIPLVIFDDFRLNVAQELGLAPGRDAEQLATAQDGDTLVVLPLGEYDGIGQERYRYKAEFIGRPVAGGTELTAIDTGETITIPLTTLDFVAADADGAHVLFRGPLSGSGADSAFLVDTNAMTASALPEGRTTPDIEGDWETPVWAKTPGICDRYSPEQRFVACYKRADAASYLAGDWQIDVQLYGDYRVVEPLYRGTGFLPMVGFAHHDTWLYFQNEHGIWRIEIPRSLQEKT